MPNNFAREWYVRHTRTLHKCEQCSRTIEIGEAATKAVIRDNSQKAAPFRHGYFCTSCAQYKGPDALEVYAQERATSMPIKPKKPKIGGGGA